MGLTYRRRPVFKWDTLMENNGDTVVLVFRDDSLFYLDVSDFSDIPPQDTSEFNLVSAYTYPVLPEDSLVIDSTDTYTFLRWMIT